ncbi:glycosyltransferase family 2 protein [Arenibacter sp. GZD96]|uniref:glycosyltransferase family 2 protein n=1 Tax=Aurantibrevibacter litoralis TaxID=3106030 RepID=UPI002AFF435C|nr:glycosyltransferase family 2 protein [Arenibacter sp. GZD-96]MEA1784573.1 glycosyltransferase family 2 protein [Arenibacter sp. GZD-96]
MKNEQPTLSVILSTYNAEDWLEKALWGYQNQSFKDFEIVIADDGSSAKTKMLLQRMQLEVFFPIIHIWQPDEGFQKTRILNKAIAACRADYIVMSDGDCIPRKDFLEVHYTHRQQGYFLSGGYFKLPKRISEEIDKEHILKGKCFKKLWLEKRGLASSIKTLKLQKNKEIAHFLNSVTTSKASWNGHNASGWKSDIFSVNGFDERMQYGGEDRELGERLFNLGIKSKQIRFSAVCVHLHHQRSYKTKESIEKNKAIRKNTKKQKVVWTPYGIAKETATKSA